MNKKFLIVLIVGFVIVFSIIGWMGWKGYQLQKGEILVIIDKTEYEKGETLRVKIKNNFGQNICFSSCYPYYLERKNGKWESYKYVECHRFNGNGYCIDAKEEKFFELTLPEIPEGFHRLAIPVCAGCKDAKDFTEDKRFYSNKFWIREREGVAITTDKAEYVLGETVKITVRNNLDKSIWDFGVCGSQPWWGLQKLEEGRWQELVLSFPVPSLLPEGGEEECIPVACEKPDLLELKSGNEISYKWELGEICQWVPGKMETKPELIEEGSYRVFIGYGPRKDFSYPEGKIIYSNEFTIK